jgi:acetoin utilization deacetylase AcuC-like enzyme
MALLECVRFADLVLVSAGFDCAEGDPLGGCRVTASGFFHMTRQLMSLASGRVLVALEGGYNLESISAATVACTSALLGEAGPPAPAETVPTQLQPSDTLAIANEVLDRAIRIHHRYWSALKLPREVMARVHDDGLVDAMQSLALHDPHHTGTVPQLADAKSPSPSPVTGHGASCSDSTTGGRCSTM